MARTVRSLFFFLFRFYIYFLILFYVFIIEIIIICILIIISPLLAAGIGVGRLCWVRQGPVVLATGGSPINLDSRVRAYCVYSRCE